jgi:hypothetical protein
MKPRTNQEKIKSAALMRVKYELQTGKKDDGFLMVYLGVLEDLKLKEEEVEKYIADNREELVRFCTKKEL